MRRHWRSGASDREVVKQKLSWETSEIQFIHDLIFNLEQEPSGDPEDSRTAEEDVQENEEQQEFDTLYIDDIVVN